MNGNDNWNVNKYYELLGDVLNSFDIYNEISLKYLSWCGISGKSKNFEKLLNIIGSKENIDIIVISWNKEF